MESLASLPVKNDTMKTPEEDNIIKQLFAKPPTPATSATQPADQPPAPLPQNKPPSKINWKFTGLAIFLFILLANPFVDNLISKLPYCGGSAGIMGVKTVLFAILLVLINLFF